MGSGAEMDQLVLKRAAASRLSGEWSEDDYDVLCEGAVVGHIMKAAAAPVGEPWLWTLAYGHHEDRTPIYGARLRWRRSPRVGDGNRPAPPVANRWCAQRARRAREIVRRAEKRAGRLAMASRMLPSSDGGEALSQDKPILCGILGKQPGLTS
jgi:hypothetical protein